MSVQGRPYAVVPGEFADADILSGTLDGLVAAIRRALVLSAADGIPRQVRKDGKVVRRFVSGREVS